MEDYYPHASSFAVGAEWVELSKVSTDLAFDHNMILDKGIKYLKDQIDHQLISNLLPSKFTLSQLQNLYEILLGEKLDKRNFRKHISKQDEIIKTSEKQEGVPHKPAYLYTYKEEGNLKI